MKRDFNTVLLTLDGTPFEAEPARPQVKDGKVVFENGEPVIAKPAVPLTLRRVTLDAIGANLDSDRSMSGDDKFTLYALASRIVNACAEGKPTEVDDQEMTKLKARIAQCWPILVVGRAFEVLGKDFSEVTPAA